MASAELLVDRRQLALWPILPKMVHPQPVLAWRNAFPGSCEEFARMDTRRPIEGRRPQVGVAGDSGNSPKTLADASAERVWEIQGRI
ncbi:hypothetical protein BIW11_14011 [Tropilaelaps mercedesae]|uniref:Uncharacterized protein n=1 Tax=Tropilaelaps mercedesae TaxID=418985 RepID=A0A1V9WZR0_9ACAR|nr:hypothetical protein BIW11_14011 [Tropilaelaps mercedesae]